MATSEGREPRDPIKRAVRQACAFGCVLCGIPIYEYDHMEEYSTLRDAGKELHEVDNIALLCPTHHTEKGKKLLPVEKVRAARLSPHNANSGVSTAHPLHYFGNDCSVVTGGIVAQSSLKSPPGFMIAIGVDDVPLVLFRLEDDHLLLTVTILNELDEPILVIRDNELQYLVGFWDVEFTGRNLTIRQGRGKIFLNIVFDPPSRITIDRAYLFCRGVLMVVSSDGIYIPNNGGFISGNSATQIPAAFWVGTPPPGLRAAFVVPDVPRYVTLCPEKFFRE